MLLLQRLYEVYTLIFAQRACMDLLGNGGEGGGGGGWDTAGVRLIRRWSNLYF